MPDERYFRTIAQAQWLERQRTEAMVAAIRAGVWGKG